MPKVKLYGAGSIGNHLTYACRMKGWDVQVHDIDPDALDRMKNDTYPSRYGAWDDSVELCTEARFEDEADVVIIGTPPDTHMELAMSVLQRAAPAVLLIEKPAATPDLVGCHELVDAAKEAGARLLVGYNHVLTANTAAAERILTTGAIGTPLTMSVRWLEHWGGIFAAHPWLDGPKDSYLGFSERGGGACGEHSHGINIWQHFAHVLGMGRIVDLIAMLDIFENSDVRYDRLAQLNVRTDGGLVGYIVQDVVTEPPVKTLRIQGDRGFLEWYANFDKSHDALIHGDGHTEPRRELFPKSRPDDFQGEIDHIGDILADRSLTSPISAERGFETVLAIAAAHESHASKKAVRLDYGKGYCTQAITIPR